MEQVNSARDILTTCDGRRVDVVLQIRGAVAAEEYISPPGGKELFNPARFEAAGIRLTIREPFKFTYECKGYQFEPGLSVIDALMWVAPDQIRQRLDESRSAT